MGGMLSRIRSWDEAGKRFVEDHQHRDGTGSR
jgi:hypothetical protein